MHKIKRIEDLLSKEEVELLESLENELKELKGEFNVVNFFKDAIKENAWTRIFSFLLNSNSNHNLSVELFKYWAKTISKENEIFENFCNSIEISELSDIKSKPEWTTDKGRRLDLLIKLFNKAGHLTSVIGLENKVDSGEKVNQLSDYQKALVEAFPDIPKIILFCSPNGREAQTSERNSECRCVPTSYSSFQSVCREFTGRTEGQVNLFLQALSSHLRKLLVEEEIKMLQRKKTEKLGNPSQSVMYSKATAFFNKLEEWIDNTPFPFNWTYKTFSTNEAYVDIEDFRMEIEGHRFVPGYLVNFEKAEPGIGDEVLVRVVINYEKLQELTKDRKANEVSRILRYLRVPNSRSQIIHWDNIVNLWASESYKSVDMAEIDLENLKKLLIRSINETYREIVKKLKPFLESEGVETRGLGMDKGPWTVNEDFKLEFDMELVDAHNPNCRKKQADILYFKGTVKFRGRVFKDATMRIKEDEIKLSDELNKAIDDSDWDQFVKMALHYSDKLYKGSKNR